tara:strand:- start:1645 stop:1857 length:213 start_codon:yes stop_codon:yes gene_type:complete
MGVDFGENTVTVGQNGIVFHDATNQTQAGVVSNASLAGGGSGIITNVVILAQGTYDALTPQAGTLYLITE